jgi:hypothetical protein
MNSYKVNLKNKIDSLQADLEGFNGLEYIVVCNDQISVAIDEYNTFHRDEKSVHNDFDFAINKDEYLSLMRESIITTQFQHHLDRLLTFDESVFPILGDSLLQSIETDFVKLTHDNKLENVKLITISCDIHLKQVIFRLTYYDKSHPELEETPGYLLWLENNIIKESNELTNLKEEYPNFDDDLICMIGMNWVYQTWIYPLLINQLKYSIVKIFQSPKLFTMLDKYGINENVEIFMIEEDLPVARLH